MKKFKLKKEDFIGGYFIKNKTCDQLIEYFNNNKNKAMQGKTIKKNIIGEHKEIKESLDLYIHEENYITNNYFNELQNCLNKYIKTYPSLNLINRFNLFKPVNIQYYKKNQGFKKWHSERSALHVSNRVLVFMTYLNDVPDGGTSFMNQKITTPAKKGLTLIWPTDFTHTHKSQISKKYEKYIITGWFCF
jgi:hypothetical protein